MRYNDWDHDNSGYEQNQRRQNKNRIINDTLDDEMESLKEFEELDYIGAYDDES